jgi:hypothetical protein
MPTRGTRKRWFIGGGSIAVLITVVLLAAAPALKRHYELVKCGNQMHVVLYVACLEWPGQHGGYLPTNFLSMSNELISPKLFLVCPSDHLRQPAASWSSFTSNNCSYEIVTPGLRKGDTNSVFLRCKVHGYTGYADDTLLDASGRLVRPDRLL